MPRSSPSFSRSSLRPRTCASMLSPILATCSWSMRQTRPTWTTSLLRGSPRSLTIPPMISSSCSVPPPSASSTSKRSVRSPSGTSRSSRSCCASWPDMVASKTSFEIFVKTTFSRSSTDRLSASGSIPLWRSRSMCTNWLVSAVCRSLSFRRVRMRTFSFLLAVDRALSTNVAMMRLKIPNVTSMMTSTYTAAYTQPNSSVSIAMTGMPFASVQSPVTQRKTMNMEWPRRPKASFASGDASLAWPTRDVSRRPSV
mmetsp:Transcript_53458/g.143213  ORF Transcript_53458/g.143213 Transcript_53458/m.143213 type:complete len:255 (-) Transcript_53458:699-1463(-)